MTLPAAQVTNTVVCPAVTGVVPHVGIMVVLGEFTVLAAKMPASRLGDMTTCVGPPGTILKGSATVLTGKKPQARILDNAAHGGMVIGPGAVTVLVGG
ncbi:MAG: PAAR domain-containing protein [Pseudomonadota bacterium]